MLEKRHHGSAEVSRTNQKKILLMPLHDFFFSNLTAEVTRHCLKVQQLEAYLGGEIPDLEVNKLGSTWKEERHILCSEIQVRGLSYRSLSLHTHIVSCRRINWKLRNFTQRTISSMSDSTPCPRYLPSKKQISLRLSS